ncbi:LLM class flavin-dependent oxidoreductase, partial [Actinomyces oris]
MKAFGFLSFGHYGHGRGPGDPDAGQALKEAVEIAVGADEIGVNGAYWRVHHYARQAAAPIPLLSAAGARTRRIEVGTGVIDMRYENPLYLAEEVAALD